MTNIIQWPKNDELAIRQVMQVTFPTGYQKHLEQRQAFYRDRVLERFFAGERDINKALRDIYVD